MLLGISLLPEAHAARREECYNPNSEMEMPKLTCRGYVRNGVVVLDEPAPLPEGSRVEVSLLPQVNEAGARGGREGKRQALMKYAGACSDLPEDAATNLEQYLNEQRCP